MCTIAGTGTTTITANQASQGYLYAAGSSSTLMTVYENHCTSHVNPCLNGGTCMPDGSGGSCACAMCYMGATCEEFDSITCA